MGLNVYLDTLAFLKNTLGHTVIPFSKRLLFDSKKSETLNL